MIGLKQYNLLNMCLYGGGVDGITVLVWGVHATGLLVGWSGKCTITCVRAVLITESLLYF